MNVQATVTLRTMSERDILLAMKALRDQMNAVDIDAAIAVANVTQTTNNTHYFIVIQKLAKILAASKDKI